MTEEGKTELPEKRDRAPRRSLVPIEQDFEAFDLETSFLEESQHHRWLLTTCIAGIAATLLVGGITLGIFGQNAVPERAIAATGQQGSAQRQSGLGDANLQTASAGGAKTEVLPERSLNGDWAYPEIDEEQLPYGEQTTTVLDSEVDATDSEQENITTITKQPPPEPVDESFQAASAKEVIDRLTDLGVSQSAAKALVKSVESQLPLKTLKGSADFTVTLDAQYDFYGREVIFPVELSFKPSPKQTLTVEADEDGNFQAKLEGKSEEAAPQVAAVAELRSNDRIGAGLYSTAKDNRVPDYIVSEFTRIFSFDVDLQRELSPSDSYEMFYGKALSGGSSKRKVLHYARLNFNGRSESFYRFTTSDGRTDYYDENGRSAARALLKTPVPGARLTSGFGMRVHPLLGYSKLHAGVDFGAPTGTPIHAAANGVVDIAGRHGTFGILVVLKHGTKYKTLYAHMSRLAAGVRSGATVNQGQVIGYIGTTGRSTGPHLHYEVRVNDKPVNPTTIRSAGGTQLAGKDLQNFRDLKQKVATLMSTAPLSTQVAQNGQ